MRLRTIAINGEANETTFVTFVVRIGHESSCEIQFDAAAHPEISGLHATIEIRNAAAILRPFSIKGKTLLNGRSVKGASPVAVGDRIQIGANGPIVEIVELPIAAPAATTLLQGAAGEERAFESTVQAHAADVALLRGSATTAERFPIPVDAIIGRNRDMAQIVLDHPHVSRLHAHLTTWDDRVELADMGSANGTFVNGRRLAPKTTLKLGDRIDIGPFSLVYTDGALVSRSRANNIELTARGINRVVKDRSTGQTLHLLNDINLVVRPREFVCVLGPSGSGKSTLLGILSGRQPPSGGSVAINGQNLHAHFDSLKQQIAVVPQKDILHETLTVGAALRYTAELRLPPDTSRDEIATAVSDILDVVGLTERRNTTIRYLSGGQIKRASLANELMARPSLLFLDEVTSGLDEQTDHEVMDLFRRVADGGKTVVCITHNLTNVEASAHLVLILTEGGRLGFIGTPDEAKGYFGIRRLGDVYHRLAERKPEEWQSDFQKSPHHARYIAERMPAQTETETALPSTVILEALKTKAIGQTSILMRRYVAIWRGDRPALFALLGQSLLVALLLGMVFGNLTAIENPLVRIQRTVNLLFLLNVSSFWFGCNTAAKELVKDRTIFMRERGFNLRVDSYLASKLGVLLFIGSAQVTLLFGIVRLWCEPPGSAILQLTVLLALMVAGTVLGLLFSAVARTEEMATALVPIAVIPQIILAGVIAPVSGLSEAIASAAITCYHGQGGLESLLPVDDRMLAGLPERSIVHCLLMAAAHAGLFLLVTYLILIERTRPRKSA